MIKLFTIGFTEKSAEEFFNLLRSNKVKKIMDIRLNNVSQLSGYAKGSDLKFFAKEICKIEYEHNVDFAPTKEILSRYRDEKITWQEYESEYLKLLDMRKIAQKIDINKLHMNCLLCSENTPENCHRRLLAQYLKHLNKNIKIIHLIK